MSRAIQLASTVSALAVGCAWTSVANAEVNWDLAYDYTNYGLDTSDQYCSGNGAYYSCMGAQMTDVSNYYGAEGYYYNSGDEQDTFFAAANMCMGYAQYFFYLAQQ